MAQAYRMRMQPLLTMTRPSGPTIRFGITLSPIRNLATSAGEVYYIAGALWFYNRTSLVKLASSMLSGP